MVAVLPVEAWVVEPAWAPTVVGEAYDALRPEQRRQIAEANPDSFFNVVRSAVDYGPKGAPAGVLDDNAHALDRLLREGRYRAPTRRALYLYQLRSPENQQVAVIGDVPVAAFHKGEVRAHERTRAAKEAELGEHLAKLRMSSSPVGLTYRKTAAVDAQVARAIATTPLLDFPTVDGVRHAVWEVPPPLTKALVDAFTAVPLAYIIDGHHRVAAAARVGDECFLAGLVPDDQLHLLPYHRVVAGPLPLPPEVMLERLGAQPLRVATAPDRPGDIALYVGGRWYRARLNGGEAGRLDAELVSRQVLRPFAGVADARDDARLDFLPGSAGLEALAALAARRRGMAVALHPPSVEQLLAEADAGRTMPPKSTWFEPKFRSGIFVVRRPPLRREAQ